MAFNVIIAIALLVSTLVLEPPRELSRTGKATYYAKNIFNLVWQYRSTYMEPCKECIGYIALLDPRDIGETVWVEHDNDVYGPYYSIDCASTQHRQYLVNRGWVADLEWELAQELDMNGPITVTIHFVDPGAP